MAKFVKLMKLADVTYEGESDESKARWARNLDISGVKDGWCLGDDGQGEPVVKGFQWKSLTRTSEIKVYDFGGQASGEDERFFDKDAAVYRHNDGSYWVEDSKDLWEF